MGMQFQHGEEAYVSKAYAVFNMQVAIHTIYLMGKNVDSLKIRRCRLVHRLAWLFTSPADVSIHTYSRHSSTCSPPRTHWLTGLSAHIDRVAARRLRDAEPGGVPTALWRPAVLSCRQLRTNSSRPAVVSEGGRGQAAAGSPIAYLANGAFRWVPAAMGAALLKGQETHPAGIPEIGQARRVWP